MVAFTKTHIGGGRFVVEWNLSVPDGVTTIDGDTFDTAGAELLSVQALGPTDISVKLYSGNQSNLLTAPSVNITNGNNNIMVGAPFPSARWHRVSAEGVAGSVVIALLFQG